jgi:L-fuconolactonase
MHQWRGDLKSLAQRDNIRVKIGGLGTVECGFQFEHGAHPPTPEQLSLAWCSILETCVETFGARRCMLESNFPVDKQSSS